MLMRPEMMARVSMAASALSHALAAREVAPSSAAENVDAPCGCVAAASRKDRAAMGRVPLFG